MLSVLLLSAWAQAAPMLPRVRGEERVRAQFPAPRNSGEGAVPFQAQGVQLLGWKVLPDFPGGNVTCNDLWGYTAPSGREYVLIGLSEGTGFVEVTDPGAPEIVAFEAGPKNIWRGLRTYRDHAYAVSEGGGGIQVFDLSAIEQGVVTRRPSVLTGGLTLATHTLSVNPDTGFLYRAGGGTQQGIVIYDLADPAQPVLAGAWHGQYVHECQAVVWNVPGPHQGRELAFCFLGEGVALKVLDVTDKSAILELAAVSYPGAVYAHQGWLSADQRTLYLGDELDELSFGASRTRIFDVSDPAAPAYLGFFSSGASAIDHNLYVRGARIYESNFSSGLRIFDASVPHAPVEVAFFDAYPLDDLPHYGSLSSNYPFFPSGTIAATDLEKGLMLFREGPPMLQLSLVGPPPDLVDLAGERLDFTVSEEFPGALLPDSVRFHFASDGAFTAVTPHELPSGAFRGALPASSCGTELEYYFSAQSLDGTTWTDPPAAPTQVHRVRAAYTRTVVAVQDFESNLGWSPSAPGDTATMGQWTRVNPNGNFVQPEDDHSSDPGTFCYVTGQSPPGAAEGEGDVDDGVTTLRSPVFDLRSFAEPHVAYWRWFSNNQLLWRVDDPFFVDISNDGGASWVNLETVLPGDPDALGGWVRHEVRVADFVAPTGAMRLRYVAQDLGDGSIVEAALDDFELIDHGCLEVSLGAVEPAEGPFEGGNVVRVLGAGFEPGVGVSFGGRTATGVSVVSPTELWATVPRAAGIPGVKAAHLELAVDVVVTNPGADTLVRGYAYRLEQRTR